MFYISLVPKLLVNLNTWRCPEQKVAWNEHAVALCSEDPSRPLLPGSRLSPPSALIFKVSAEQERRAFPEGRTACFLRVGKLYCSPPDVIRLCLPSGWHFNLALHCQSGAVNNKYMKSVKNPDSFLQ